MTEDELAALRRYLPAEVVRLLNIPAKRLKTWVQDERVPYQCGGVERGVWFTADDIREIGGKLPELMGGRRRRRVDGPPLDPESRGELVAPAGPEPTPEIIAAWAQLAAYPSRSRAPRIAR